MKVKVAMKLGKARKALCYNQPMDIPDLWLFAENQAGSRQYIIRTREPRFITTIQDDPDDPDVSVIGDVVFIDEPAFDAESLALLMRHAGEALAAYDERLFVI